MQQFQVNAFPVVFAKSTALTVETSGLAPFYRRIGAAFFDVDEASIAVAGSALGLPIGFKKNDDVDYCFKEFEQRLPPNVAATDLIIIDFSSFGRGGQRGALLNGCRAIASAASVVDSKRNEIGSGCQVIFCLPHFLDERDISWQRFKAVASRAHICVVTDDGRLLNHPATAKASWTNDYRKILARQRAVKAEHIGRRVLRRVGVFKLKKMDQQEYYTEIYYDGSLAIKPATGFLLEKFYHRSGLKPSVVLVHSPAQSWMKSFAALLRAKLAEQQEGVEVTSFDVFNPTMVAGHSSVLVVTPFVETGNTLVAVHEKLRATFPEIGIEYFSIISTKGPVQYGGQCALNLATGTDIAVNYAVRVQPRVVRKEAFFDLKPESLMQSGLALNEEPLGLTPFSWWWMAMEAGVIGETPVPKGRSSVGFMPNVKKMIETNGAWLSAKLQQLLADPKHDDADLVLVCPQEPGAQALAQHMENALGLDTVQVPRKAIDWYEDAMRTGREINRAALEDYVGRSGDRGWYDALVSWHSDHGDEVLIMDEFLYSGSTIKSLTGLLGILGIRAGGALVIVNFSRSIHDLPVHSLYEIQLEG